MGSQKDSWKDIKKDTKKDSWKEVTKLMIALFLCQSKYEIKLIHNYICL